MDRPGDQLLPGARLTLDQDVGLGPGRLTDELEDGGHRRAPPHDVIEAGASREGLPKPAVFLDEPAPFRRALDG